MRDGESLAVLCAMQNALRLLGEDSVCVGVEPPAIKAHKNQRTLTEGSDIEFRRGACVESAYIANGDGRTPTAAREHDPLRTQEDFSGVNFFSVQLAATHQRLGLQKKLQARRDGKFCNLVDTDACVDSGELSAPN